MASEHPSAQPSKVAIYESDLRARIDRGGHG